MFKRLVVFILLVAFTKGGAEAALMNQGMVSGNTPEANLKVVNEIFIRTWAKGTWSFSPQDSATLYSIAFQNPDFGGIAVLDARVMLLYDQDDAYGYTNARIDEEVEPRQGDQLGKLYPNPTINEATYEITLGDNSAGIICIYDLFGREINRSLLMSGENLVVFDLSTYSSGMYVYRVFIGGEAKASDILVLTK